MCIRDRAKELEKKKTETEVKAQEEPEAEEVEETTENNEPEDVYKRQPFPDLFFKRRKDHIIAVLFLG